MLRKFSRTGLNYLFVLFFLVLHSSFFFHTNIKVISVKEFIKYFNLRREREIYYIIIIIIIDENSHDSV